MLSSDEKKRIQAEEIFRNEVKLSLKENLSRTGKIVRFFSGSLGIWMLSTALVGLGGWTFNETKSRIEAANKREEDIRRLDSEISYRLAGFRNLQLDVGIREGLLLLERPNDPLRPQHLFAENEKRPLGALLWELHEIVPNEEKQAIQQAYTTSLQFRAVRPVKKNSENAKSFILDALLKAALPLQFAKDFNLSRWGRQFDNKLEPDKLFGGLISADVLRQKLGPATAPSSMEDKANEAPAASSAKQNRP